MFAGLALGVDNQWSSGHCAGRGNSDNGSRAAALF